MTQNPSSAGRPPPSQIGAYYLSAHMFTSVPRHVREDMEWMADIGTDYVCVSILEQDLWAASENINLIIEEAQRANMQVLAVPSRWGGLTAGAPKVPSLFSVLHPHTWMRNQEGISGFTGNVSGVISSVHWPETLQFFRDSLDRIYEQHPEFAGLIIDEPKALQMIDYSDRALEVLGRDATYNDRLQAAVDFYDEVLGHTRQSHPEKLRMLFMRAHSTPEEIGLCARMRNLDFLGVDGRPWTLGEDACWKGSDENQESGRGKVLLDGRGQGFIEAASQHNKRSLFLIENHNLTRDMIGPMDRHLPAVLALNPDLLLYYYYPRNVQEPDRAMSVVSKHLKAWKRANATPSGKDL